MFEPRANQRPVFFHHFDLHVRFSNRFGHVLRDIVAQTGDNGNAMLPKKLRTSNIPANRFLYRLL